MTDPKPAEKPIDDAVQEVVKHDGEASSKPPAEKVAKGSLKDYFRLFRYAKPFDWLLLATCAFSSVAAGAALPVMFIVFGRIVNDLSSYSTAGSQTSADSFTSQNNSNVLYIVYIFIGKFVLSYVSLFTVRMSGLRISAALRLAYLEALFNQPLSSIDKLSTGKVSHRITTSANYIQTGISQHLAILMTSASFIISFYVVAFVYNALVTLVASAVLPVLIIAYVVAAPPLLRMYKEAEDFKEQGSGLTHEVMSSMRVVAAFGAETRLSQKHAAWNDKVKKKLVATAPYIAIVTAPTLFVTHATCALAFYFGIKQFVGGNLDNVGTLVIVYFSVVTATSQFGRFVGPAVGISQAAAAAAEIFATIDSDVPDTSGAKEPEVSALEDITLDQVRFHYPSRPDVKILNKTNAVFKAGKTTAIVGPSGSGKSTVVGLLERWYSLQPDITKDVATTVDPEKSDDQNEDTTLEPAPLVSGEIRVGSHNIETLDLKWWRGQIGFVQQEPFLFNDTIFKNVCYGLCGTDNFHADEATQRKLVEEACRQAYAHDFILAFPKGYDTMVGESGIKISGGQRQRIAIARSIVKNPPILILDEATSALDVHSERVVQKALDEVSRDRTTIIIAHRLSTIKRADSILVLRSGEVIEQGTHEDLLTQENGFYRSLVNAQELSLGDEDQVQNANDVEVGLTLRKTKSSRQAEKQESTAEDDIKKTVNKDYQAKGLLSSFGILVWEQRSRWILYTVTVASAALCGASFPLMAWVFAKLIEVFSFFPDLDRMTDRGNFWALIFFIMGLVSLVSYFILGWGAAVMGAVIPTTYKQEYFQNLVRKPIVFFDLEENSPGTLTARVATDPQQIQSVLGAEMAAILTSISNILGSALIALIFGWKLGLVGFLAVFPVIMVAGVYRTYIEIQFEKMTAAVFADSSQFATEAAGAFRTVTSLTLEDIICGRYRTLLNKHAAEALKKAVPGTLIFALSDSIDIACNALVFWYGGTLIASREYDIVQYFVIYMASVQSTQAAAQWFAMAPSMANASVSANRILSTRPSPSTDTTPPKALPPSSEGAAIDFRDVSFTYPTRSEPILNNLSLSIPAGSFAALVGASGCGKSTIINLLERFYEPSSGAILFSSTDISTLDTSSYRSQLALVAQEPTLYEGTIRENVLLGIPEDTEPSASEIDTRIETACRSAHIHDFITSLPDSYLTQLGPKGISLSGGQKQRVALARALLRQPRLLLLDEATSSLDSESEKQVQDAIEKAASQGGMTILAVAHRLATIQKADVIFVLEKGGRVVEQGGHEELVRRRGVYWEMCRAQALDR